MALKIEKDENPFEPPTDEDFLKTALEYRDHFEDEEEFQEALAIWPRCPRCGRRRVTRCPICKTSGTLFPLGDRDFWDFRSDEERASDAELFDAASRRNCACGRHSCDSDVETEETVKTSSCLDGELIPGVKDWRSRSSCGKTSDAFDALPEKRTRRRAWAEVGRVRNAENVEKPSPSCGGRGDDRTPNAATSENAENAATDAPELVVCYVCSEAFVPKFPRRCEWCDYDFGDGEDSENVEDPATSADVDAFVARKKAENAVADADEASPTRVFWTIFALALAAATLCGYFFFLMR